MHLTSRNLALALLLSSERAAARSQPLAPVDDLEAAVAPAPEAEAELQGAGFTQPVGQRVGESVSGALNTASTTVSNATGAPLGCLSTCAACACCAPF